ncbi:MAG TPA: bifunctional nuclease family protein [Acidimicrobiales bacterium]|nr:bifunctional nuclease family protein [Acidimicrobiales bacterium]
MVEVQLAAVRVDLQSKMPVVLLQERNGAKRTLPIFIGPPEATAIAFALQGVVTERPLTHDLIRDMLTAFGARLERVVVTELRGSTYYAEIHADLGGRQYTVSSRPSDAIAIAVRLGTPLFVADELLDAEGVILQADEDEDDAETPEDLVDQFREFIQGIRPEDFS